MKKNNLEFYDLNAECWWDENAKIYALHHLNQPRFQFFDRYINNWEGLNVLDVGCGGGFSCEFMAKRGAIVSGVDQSQKCIEIAKAHANNHNLQIDYQYGFAEELPYQDKTFDVVICVDVLEHVEDIKKVIAEIYRVLKPNGLFCFDTINKTFKSKLIMIWLLENILNKIPRGIHDWEKFIKPEDLTSLIKETGFNKVEIKGFNIFGESLYQNILDYFYYQKTKNFIISISDNTSVMYIGYAVKNTNIISIND